MEVHSILNKRLEKAEQDHKKLCEEALQIEADMLITYNNYIILRSKLEEAKTKIEVLENKTKIGVMLYQNIKLKGK